MAAALPVSEKSEGSTNNSVKIFTLKNFCFVLGVISIVGGPVAAVCTFSRFRYLSLTFLAGIPVGVALFYVGKVKKVEEKPEGIKKPVIVKIPQGVFKNVERVPFNITVRDATQEGYIEMSLTKGEEEESKFYVSVNDKQQILHCLRNTIVAHLEEHSYVCIDTRNVRNQYASEEFDKSLLELREHFIVEDNGGQWCIIAKTEPKVEPKYSELEGDTRQLVKLGREFYPPTRACYSIIPPQLEEGESVWPLTGEGKVVYESSEVLMDKGMFTLGMLTSGKRYFNNGKREQTGIFENNIFVRSFNEEEEQSFQAFEARLNNILNPNLNHTLHQLQDQD